MTNEHRLEEIQDNINNGSIANRNQVTIDIRDYKWLIKIAEESMSPLRTSERWESIYIQAKELIEFYKTIPMGTVGYSHISNAIERYEAGERTKVLFDILDNIK